MSCGNICHHCYCWLTKLGNFLQSFLLLAIRLLWGIGFFFAGLGKFMNYGDTVEFFSSLGLPGAEVMVAVVASVELVGGICLAVGFLSRIASLALIAVMCSAYVFAHTESLYMILQNPQMFVEEAPFNFLLASLIVFCFGPGCISLDCIWSKACCKPGDNCSM